MCQHTWPSWSRIAMQVAPEVNSYESFPYDEAELRTSPNLIQLSNHMQPHRETFLKKEVDGRVTT